MRLIKEKTRSYESFHKSLQYFTKNSDVRGDLRLISFENHQNNNNLLEKYTFFVQNLWSFQQKIEEAKKIEEIHALILSFVKRILQAKEVELFLFNDSGRHLIPLNQKANAQHVNTVNKIHRDGILDWIFESKKPTIVPDLDTYTASGSKVNQLIFPIYDSGLKHGILSLYTPITKVSEVSLENRSVQIILGIVMPVIMKLKQKDSINKLYQELQVYQSKLKNDSDVYAIGNIAEGILEEIGEPLQVILSLTDLLENENAAIDRQTTGNIKNQIDKVRGLIAGLTRFSGLNKPKNQNSQACDLNKIVKEFRNIINATLQNLGLECELDLEENIPTILSDAGEIKQLLTSIFSLLKSASRKSGAFVIQTKYIKEKVVLSVFTTEQIAGIANENEYRSNVTVRLINELMKKNEGSAEFNLLPLKGTIIHLIFPLKRKLSL